MQLALLLAPNNGWLVPGGHRSQPALLLRRSAADQRPGSHGVKTMLVSAPSVSQ